jgi:phosphatidylserine/phosphatidylglycerophosphate/cardiolipin synthase-like enzyme
MALNKESGAGIESGEGETDRCPAHGYERDHRNREPGCHRRVDPTGRWRPRQCVSAQKIGDGGRENLDPGRNPLNLKAYAIDGVLLRTGSANFSTSGENAQDNDLIAIRDADAAARFDAHFERMWNGAQPMIEFDPAVRALEPR